MQDTDENTIMLVVAYVDGEDIIVRQAGGYYVPDTGYLTTVLESIGERLGIIFQTMVLAGFLVYPVK